jgi:LysM repeat protein
MVHKKACVNIVVIPSDTLFFFSKTFGVSVEEILAVNPGIADPNLIFPGQIIRIPARAPVPPKPEFSQAQYLVRPGETLFSIARRFGLTTALLVVENPWIADPNLIFVNQVINLVVTPPPPPDLRTACFYVSVGETLLSIARRTGVSLQAIINANPQIVNPNIIFVGQIINVPLSG